MSGWTSHLGLVFGPGAVSGAGDQVADSGRVIHGGESRRVLAGGESKRVLEGGESDRVIVGGDF